QDLIDQFQEVRDERIGFSEFKRLKPSLPSDIHQHIKTFIPELSMAQETMGEKYIEALSARRGDPGSKPIGSKYCTIM
ncbi:hypothetical protein DID80_07430, partial [Candidatus Marinamargulisbacteria bacterium SCGC AAA071-K20]